MTERTPEDQAVHDRQPHIEQDTLDDQCHYDCEERGRDCDHVAEPP